MKPIVLTEYGERLVENLISKKTDEDSLNHDSIIGVHEHCRGGFNFIPVSSTHNVLLCRECGLRVVIPIKVITFGDLRRHFKTFQKASS